MRPLLIIKIINRFALLGIVVLGTNYLLNIFGIVQLFDLLIQLSFPGLLIRQLNFRLVDIGIDLCQCMAASHNLKTQKKKDE